MVGRSLTERPWRDVRWLVLAPHPDDETLGAGALIHQAAGLDRLAALVYLTDGSGSHENARGLAAVRRREAALALFRLTGRRLPRPIHLDWKDADPKIPSSSEFARSVAFLDSLCRRLRVGAIAVTASHEPHCDHSAAARLAHAVQANARGRLRLAEYCVWSAPPSERSHIRLKTSPMSAGRRRQALRAHRSQLTTSCGPGFRLPADRQRMPACDTLFLRRPR